MKRMRLYRIAGTLLILTIATVLSGQKKAKAGNMDITIEQNKAYIHYDIRARNTDLMHRVELKFLDENYNLLTPTSVSGDIGLDITGGGGKTILWDITSDMELLGTDIRPVIFIDGASRQYSNTGGPKNAFLSMLLPGLGDYFVADPRLMSFKPYMRTISSLGLIGLGFYLGEQRYRAEGYYELTLKPNSWRYEGMDQYYYRYIGGPVQYALFKGDKELFIALGASLWAADVIWVLARGTNNVKFRKATVRASRFQLGYIPGGASLQYSLTF
jgi:hypothetical protein